MMSDLIYRNKAFEVLSDYYHHTTDVQHEALKEALDRVPEADLNNNDPDVVRVVRCKDCDRSQVDFDKHGEVTFRCRLYDPWIVYVRSDGLGYCSNGIKA